MARIDEQAGPSASAERPETLEVRIARQLLDQAKAEGMSLVGPCGLLAGVTKTVLQAGVDAEMPSLEPAGHWSGAAPG